MLFVSEIEAVAVTGVFQRVRAVDEKHGVFYVVFLGEFGKDRLSEYSACGRLKS
jgi:hypothetical protein